MRIIDPGRKQISNAEVASHVTALSEKYEDDAKRQSQGSQAVPENLRRALKDVALGLSNQISQQPPHPQPPSSTSSRAAPNPVLRRLSALSAKLRAPPYKLLGSEIVQIVNSRPRDLTELGVCVEEADMRFSEEELEGMLTLIAESLDGGEVEVVNGVNGTNGVNEANEANGTDVS